VYLEYTANIKDLSKNDNPIRGRASSFFANDSRWNERTAFYQFARSTHRDD